eukprot:2402268-Rhodomonas_salina.1
MSVPEMMEEVQRTEDRRQHASKEGRAYPVSIQSPGTIVRSVSTGHLIEARIEKKALTVLVLPSADLVARPAGLISDMHSGGVGREKKEPCHRGYLSPRAPRAHGLGTQYPVLVSDFALRG